MSALKDIIWTRDESRTVRSANDLPPDTRLFNLVDGIVSLIEVSARDKWICYASDKTGLLWCIDKL